VLPLFILYYVLRRILLLKVLVCLKNRKIIKIIIKIIKKKFIKRGGKNNFPSYQQFIKKITHKNG